MPLLSKPLLERISPVIRVSNPAAKRELRQSAQHRLRTNARFDVFISHRFLDAPNVLLFRNYLDALGYSVFVDWIEAPNLHRENVTKRTAAYLRSIMDRSESLLYAASDDSSESKWMPWELGYFDGSNGRVAIVPIKDWETTSETYRGLEYLGLYPYVTLTPDQSGAYRLWVNTSASNYVLFDDWIWGG